MYVAAKIKIIKKSSPRKLKVKQHKTHIKIGKLPEFEYFVD